MSDVNANIGISFDATEGLQQLRQLQAGLSRFNQSLTQGNITAAAAQKSLNAQLMQAVNATGKFVASQKTVAASTTAFTDALEKNKFSLKEYFRYTAAAASANTKVLSNMFAQEREIINRARKDRVKSLQSQYIQLTNAQGELVKVLQVVPKHLEMVNGKYTDYATRVQMAAQRQQLLNQLIKQGSTQLLNFGKNTQWAGRQLMVGLTVPLTMLGSFASQTFKDMEMAALKFSRVYGDMFSTGDATNKALEDIKKLGMEFTKYGVAVKDTINMAADAAAMGLTGSNLTSQVSAATKLSVLGQVEQQQALETTISLQNAFGISSDQLAQKINFLNAVENQTVLSISDLTEAIPKAGPVVKQLGGNVEDLAFFMTAMKEGGINASEGANALKSGLASLINPSKKASEMLAGLGINIKGIVEANAGDLKGTVVGFAQALDTLDPLNRARAIEQLFGKFQFARLSTLFQNITKSGSQAMRTFQLAGASVEELAILSERELGKVENAVSIKFQKSIEQLKVQLAPVGKAFMQALTPIIQFFGKVLEKFNNLGDGTKKTIAIITGVLAGIAPVALMTFGLLANGAANIVKMFGLLRGGMAKLNGQNSVLGGGFDYLTQQELDNLAQSNALHTSHQNLIETFNIEVGSLNALAAAYGSAASQARNLASANPGIFNSVPGAKGSVTKLPKYAKGILSVPGPKGAGDIIPAMVSPGETIVPAKQSEKHRGLLSAVINDSIPGFAEGRDAWASQAVSRINLGPKVSAEGIAKALGADLGKVLSRAAAQGLDQSQVEKHYKDAVDGAISELGTLADYTKETFKKLRDEALKPMFDKTGIQTARYQQEKGQFAHVGQPVAVPVDKVLETVNITNSKMVDEINNTVAALKNAGQPMPTARIMSMSAYDTPGWLNRVMAEKTKGAQANFESGGTSVVDAFMNQFQADGPKKWKRTTDALGITFDKVHNEFKAYDDDLLNRVKQWKQQNPNGLFNDEVFAGLEQQARQNATAGVRQIMTVADNIISGIRVSLTDAQAKIVQEYSQSQGLNIPKVVKGATGNRKFSNAESRKFTTAFGTFDSPGSSNTPQSLAGRVKKDLDNAEKIAETRSPSKRTKRLGKNIAEGLAQGIQEGQVKVKKQTDRMIETATGQKYTSQQIKDKINSAKTSGVIPEGTQVVNSFVPSFYPDGKMVIDADGNPLPPKEAKKLLTRYKRGARREAVGQYSGKFAGGLGTAAMVSGMLGGPGQLTAGLGVASMAASFAPALAGLGPLGIAGVSITALGAAALLAKKNFDSMIQKQVDYIKQTSATTEKMKQIGEITGKVGASELYARKRQEGASNRYTQIFERGQSQFGTDFLQSEIGKSIKDNFVKDMASGGEEAAKKLGLQLSAYISDGILTTEQAYSIARQIGLDLGNMTLGTKIQGEVTKLVGPDGQNLLLDPLTIRVKLITTQESIGNTLVKAAEAASKTNGFGVSSEASITNFAAATAMQSQQLTMVQAQRDAQNKMYDDQIRSLEAQKAATTDKAKQLVLEGKIQDAKAQQKQDDEKLASYASKTLTATEKLFDKSLKGKSFGQIGMNKNAVISASRDAINAKYTGDAAPLAKAFLSQTKGLKSEKIEVLLNTIVAGGQLDPISATNLLNIFGKNEEGMYRQITTALKLQDPGKVQQLLSLLGNLPPEIAQKVFVDMTSKDGAANFDNNMNTLNSLMQLDGKELNLAVFLKTDGALDRLSKLLDKIDTAIGNGPVTVTMIEDIQKANPDMPDMSALIADWDKWKDKDPKIQKSVVITYTELFNTIGKSEIAQYRKDKGIASTVSDTAVRGLIANELLPNKVPTSVQSNKSSSSTPSDVGAKANPLAFLDDLAQRLKNVRQGAFDATKPLESLLAAFSNPKVKKDAAAMFNIFDGLQNRLMKLGAAKEFRDAIASMSNEDFAKVAALKGKKALFTFESGKPRIKANITGLTTTGKAVSAAYQEEALGRFNVVQQETIQNTKDQATAFNMLVASGMSTAAALKTVEDTSVASAIAAGRVGKTGSTEMKTFVTNINTANDALEKQAVLNNLIAKNNEFEIVKKMPALASTMKDLGYSVEQIATVMSDPQLAQQMMNDLKDGKLDSKDIADYLNSIEAKKVIDIQVKLNSGDYVGVAKEAMNAVDEMFSVQEEMIRLGMDPRSSADVAQMKANNTQIDSLSAQVHEYQKQVDKLNTEIADGQRSIELNYTRPIEDMQNKISGLDRELEISPIFGNRLIQGLQDQSSALSHDLDIISHSADQINEQYDKQAEALKQVAEANAQIVEQQKQQLDLADAITSGDIAAAAKAAQEMRATQAKRFADTTQNALDQARQNALSSLKGPSGLTETEIKEKQYQLSQQIYAIENNPQRIAIQKEILSIQDQIYNKDLEKQKALDLIRIKEDEVYNIQRNQIKPLQDQIDELTYQNDLIQKRIDKLVEEETVLGKTRAQWAEIKLKIAAADLASKDLQGTFNALLQAVTAIDTMWANILAKLAQYKGVQPGGGGGGGGVVDTTTNPALTTFTTTQQNIITSAQDAAAAAFEVGNDRAAEQIAVQAMKDLAAAQQVDANTSIAGTQLGSAQVVSARKQILGYLNSGGLVPQYFANGGYARGFDTVPAMLTPGEFVMSKYAVQSYGIDNMKAINNGKSVGDSVYNYDVSVNVRSDANPNEIAQAVMTQIRNIDAQRIRGNRI